MADDNVHIFNPQKGAAILPGIGILKPGWNEVERKAYVEAPVKWNELPFQVRDPSRKEGPKDISVEDAAQMALDTNDIKLLNKMRDGEKRKAVLSAIDHQTKVLTLDKLDGPALEELLKGEKREQVRKIIEKAITAAQKA